MRQFRQSSRSVLPHCIGLACVLSVAGCGGNSNNACVTGPLYNIGPPIAGTTIADHRATPPLNQVHFIAYFGVHGISGNCTLPTDLRKQVQATWTSTDPADIMIDSGPGFSNGTATCVNASSGPVTLTATYVDADFPTQTQTATTTMTCQ